MAEYKASNYTFAYPSLLGKEDDKVYIYNSRTGALVALELDKYAQYIDYLDNEIPLNEELLQGLLKCGYLIPKDMDELKWLKIELMKNRFDGSRANITIAPTSACNFRCSYCFESGGGYKSTPMTDETANNIIKYIESRAQFIDRLNLTWYGGEPLLALDRIVSMSSRIIKICEDSKIEYYCSVITNGYLLNRSVVNTLLECRVSDIQVTIDGPKEIHDRRRPLANGGGTFDSIVAALKEIKGMVKINVRINTDNENMNDIQGVVDYFREQGLLEHIVVYLGLVASPNDNYDDAKCLSDEVYSKFSLKFMLDNDIPLLYIYPHPKGNYCGADHFYGVVFDEGGFIYKCWSDIGIAERRVGNINSSSEVATDGIPLLSKYLLFDPTEDERCKDCKYMPICLGGCPRNRLSNLNICERYRYNLDEYMKECTKYIVNGGLS